MKQWQIRAGVFVLAMLILGILLLLGQNPKPVPSTAPNSTLEVYFLDVGQGDSEFFRDGNYTMLVDCGTSDKGDKISNYLIDNLGLRKLDYLLITHTDYDHLGGCAEVLQNLYVRSVIMDGQKRDTAAYNRTMAAIGKTNLIIAAKGQDYEFGDADMRILHANTGSSKPNQNSIVFMLYFGNFSLLMATDCDLGCEASLLNENIDADVLKVAHHGSAYATSDAFLAKVTPELAVIEVGKNNYGQPANETLARLRDAGVQILRTDLNGTIVLTTNGSGYTIRSG